MNASLWDSPLGLVADQVARRERAPAGVAAAVIAATMGVSLVIKVLTIREQRADLCAAAELIAAELRVLADADCAAVRASLHSDAAIQVPIRAAQVVARALDLCVQAAPSVTGLLAADLNAARELLDGSRRAIQVCIDANDSASTSSGLDTI